MWEVIAKISTRGQDSAVVLTTHSMEECEALCTRVSIMVGGRLRCIGSVQHLKSKFGQGLMIDIQLKEITPEEAAALAERTGLAPLLAESELAAACASLGMAGRASLLNTENDSAWPICNEILSRGSCDAAILCTWWLMEDRVTALAAFMSQHFPGAQLAERQSGKLRMRLPVASMSIGDAFQLMQTHKTLLAVQEYSLSQTTLEQIFNQFAAQQEEETSGAHGIVGSSSSSSSSSSGGGVLPVAQNAQQVQMEVTVPLGVTAGQLLALTAPDGSTFNVAVPQGMEPGQIFCVNCPAPAPTAGSLAAPRNVPRHIV